MFIQINHASERSVYQQIMDQIKKEIALGRLRVEERLPTVRQLAAELAINPNTIAKAYRQLEQERVIVTRAGAGAFVAALGTPLDETVCKDIICNELERITVEAVHMQIPRIRLLEWFEAIIGRFNFEQVAGAQS